MRRPFSRPAWLVCSAIILNSKGLSQAQIDAWYIEEGKISAARVKAQQAAIETPNLENCAREIAAKIHGKWEAGAKPSEDDCRPFAAQIQAEDDSLKAASEARIHHAKNTEIMAQCYQMVDVPNIDWAALAALRHITVTSKDCARFLSCA
jgi:hypothetical protein